MTNPSRRHRLEAIAERMYLSFWSRNGWADPMPFAKQADAIRSMWANIAEDSLTEIARLQSELTQVRVLCGEAAGLLEAGYLRHLHVDGVWCCNICDAEVPDDATPNMRAADACAALAHTPDCLVTKLRTEAGKGEDNG